MKPRILFLFIALIMACTENTNKPLVIGHRGAMGHETENTLASISKAMELGADMIEIDVFRIDSGEIVVFHDDRVERLSNGAGRIEEYNVVDLKALTLEGNHKIPLLQEVLRLVDNSTRLNIELKGANTADRVNFITSHYIEKQGWSLENFLISSFNWEELRAMRSLNPDIPIAILTDDNPMDALAVAKELRAEAINPNYKELNKTQVQRIQEAGFKVFPWTVNEPRAIAEVISMGVDGVITDFPERVQ